MSDFAQDIKDAYHQYLELPTTKEYHLGKIWDLTADLLRERYLRHLVETGSFRCHTIVKAYRSLTTDDGTCGQFSEFLKKKLAPLEVRTVSFTGDEALYILSYTPRHEAGPNLQEEDTIKPLPEYLGTWDHILAVALYHRESQAVDTELTRSQKMAKDLGIWKKTVDEIKTTLFNYFLENDSLNGRYTLTKEEYPELFSTLPDKESVADWTSYAGLALKCSHLHVEVGTRGNDYIAFSFCEIPKKKHHDHNIPLVRYRNTNLYYQKA